MIVRAKWLLDKNSKPSRDEIKSAIQPHLCRCTGYEKIVQAIESAASIMRGEIIISEPRLNSATLVGLEIPRRDALAKATGTTLFADDIPVDNCAYIKVVRSPHYHAEIVNIDKSEALKIPGVLAVLTAEDVQGTNILKMSGDDQPILCTGKVRMIGDPVAAVVATSEGVASDAVERVKVTYKELVPILSVEEALKDGGPQVHDGKSNIFFKQPILYGDADKGFKEADVVIEQEIVTQCVDHAYLESDAGIAYIHENGQLVVMTGSQNIYDHKMTIAEAVGINQENVRVIQTPTGGAFGGKLDVSVGGLLGVAALALQRPVKLVYSREETFAVTTKRHPFHMKAKLGVKKDGIITAYDLYLIADGGAYKSFSSSVVTRGLVHASGPYRIRNARLIGKAVYTNTAIKGAMRGFGAPQTIMAIESSLDEAASRIGMDPLEIRVKNGFIAGDTNICGQTLTDNFGFQECLATIKPRYDTAVNVAKSTTTETLKRGVGLGSVIFGPGSRAPDHSEAWAEILPDDRLRISIGAADMGQGSDTMFAQVAAEAFKYPLEKVLVSSTDTNKVPNGNKSSGSRQTYVSGRAVHDVAGQLRKVMDENGCRTYAEMKAKGIETISKLVYTTNTTKLDPVDGHGVPWETYSFGVQMAEVAVDIANGKVAVLKITAVYDIGTVINKINTDGQVWGGIAQGLGYALSEEYIYNQTNNFVKYRIPRAKDMPEVEIIYIQIPRENGPFGASGMAELCLVPTAAAIVNAVNNACGVRMTQLPITPERLRKFL